MFITMSITATQVHIHVASALNVRFNIILSSTRYFQSTITPLRPTRIRLISSSCPEWFADITLLWCGVCNVLLVV